MIVVEERGVRRRSLVCQRFVSRPVHQVDVEPAIVVIINEPDTGADRLKDVRLLGRAGDLMPSRQPGTLGNVLEDHGTGIDETSSRNGPMLRVEDCGMSRTGVHSHSGIRHPASGIRHPASVRLKQP